MSEATPGKPPAVRAHDAVTPLAALAAGLCQDAGIGVEVRPGPWSWDPVRRVIQVSVESVEQDGLDVCLGILAREVGHYFLTRHHLFLLDFPSFSAGKALMDALDDARVDGWMVGRYPGVEPWLAQVADRFAPPVSDGADSSVALPPGMDPDLPEFLLFCLECGYEPLRDWAPAPYKLPQEVIDALAETRRARQAYAEVSPPTDVDSEVPPGVSRAYRVFVWPALLFPRWLPSRREQMVQLKALEAAELAEERIFPAAEWLFRRDVGRIERLLNEEPGSVARARRALDQGESRELVLDAMRRTREDPGPSTPWIEDLAYELMESMIREEASGRPGGPLSAPLMERSSSMSRLPWEPGAAFDRLPPLNFSWAPRSNYDREYRTLSRQIDELTEHLEEVLRPRRRLSEKSGYPSGRKVDLRKLMVFDADPRRYSELWIRNTIPDRRRVAISLLVDLSGSMSGEKARAALLGTILMAETLARLDVDFAINGFQDKLIRFCTFSEKYTDEIREGVSGMIQEVEGSRPGGNNQPGYNDDGPCVLDAAHELLDFPATDRILVVVSDGEPAGARSNEQDLVNAVAELTKPDVPLELMGLGLGANTDHVRKYYPDSVASVPVENFAREIGALVERILIG